MTGEQTESACFEVKSGILEDRERGTIEMKVCSRPMSGC